LSFTIRVHSFALIIRRNIASYEEPNQYFCALGINGARQPALVVNDLKLETNQSGSVGLWTEIGTVAYFSNLKVDYYK
jgi:hypothetical protein